MGIKAFSGKYFSEFMNEVIKKLEAKINGYSDYYILNAKEQDLKSALNAEFHLANLQIDFENEKLEHVEKEVEIRRYASMENRYASLLSDPTPELVRSREKRSVIEVHYGYEGDPELLALKTSTFGDSYTVEVSRGYQMSTTLYFDVVRYNENTSADEIRKEITSKRENIKRHLGYLDQDIRSYNENVLRSIDRAIENKKKQVQEKHSFLVDLGIPVQKRDSVPQTFAIPAPVNRKKIQVDYPAASSTAVVKPDPTLDAQIYNEILSLLNDVGKAFEKYPSICEGKNEESIRDILLLFLETNFQLMSATAESFNKNGKTDILLKYQKHNVFVAECKVWNGEKRLLEKDITQLLGYLTWRDSKSSLLIFVRENTIEAILQRINEAITKHPNFVSSIPKKDQSWFGYKMTLPDAQDKEVNLAVIVFHLPAKVKNKQN